jgi:hypothetical protein
MAIAVQPTSLALGKPLFLLRLADYLHYYRKKTEVLSHCHHMVAELSRRMLEVSCVHEAAQLNAITRINTGGPSSGNRPATRSILMTIPQM